MKELVDRLLQDDLAPWYAVLSNGNVEQDMKKRVLGYLRARERLLVCMRHRLYG